MRRVIFYEGLTFSAFPTTITPTAITTKPTTTTTTPTDSLSSGPLHNCGGPSNPTSYPTTPTGCFLSNIKAIPLDSSYGKLCDDIPANSPEECQYICQRTYYGKVFVYDSNRKRCTVLNLGKSIGDQGKAIIMEASGFVTGLQFCWMDQDKYLTKTTTTLYTTTIKTIVN